MAAALSEQEMQWAQAWQRTLITDAHSASELHAPLKADHRGKSIRSDTLEVIASFCYLWPGGCELSTTTGVKTAWKKFTELLSVLSSRHLSFKTRDPMYSSCVWSAMLHASETWLMTKPNLQCLQWNDRAMIRQICNVKPQDIVTTRSNELLAWLDIEDLDLILKERKLCWYGHVERSNGAVKTAFDIQFDGKHGLERPEMTWQQLTERDCIAWKMSDINPHDRHTWRSGMRSALHTTSQLLQVGPLMWIFPCTCTLIKNPMMMKMKSNMTGKDGKDVDFTMPSTTLLFWHLYKF